MRKDKKDNLILNLTFKFSTKIIEYTEILVSEKKYVISKQLFRSGTAIGASVREAQNAESKLDFIHKFKIAAKEMDETEYWLELCQASYKHSQVTDLLLLLEEISKIITRIISSTKTKLKQSANHHIG